LDICFAFRLDKIVLHYIGVLHENDDQSKSVGLEYLLGTLGLGGLLLALALLVSGGASKGLLEDLEDLLVLDLLVRLELLEVNGVGGSELGQTVLGDG
jgi:hypothetical protein